MSTETVDILVKARDNAIDVLKDVQKEIAKTGTVSDKTRAAYVDVRKEITLQNRSLNTLRLAYQDQHQTLQLASRAFQSLSSVVGSALSMYEKYTVAMIRENQLQDSVRATQEKYNDSVARFGKSSSQAEAALKDLTESHKKLESAQQQNVLMYAGFILQLPGLVGGLNNVRIAFMVLAAQHAASTAATEAGTVAVAAHTIASGADATATGGLATATTVTTGAMTLLTPATVAVNAATVTLTPNILAEAAAMAADATATEGATAARSAFAAVGIAGGIGLAIAGIAALTYWFSLHLTPAVKDAVRSLIELEGGMAHARMGTKDWQITITTTTRSMDVMNKALQDQIAVILEAAKAHRESNAAVKELAELYTAGTIEAKVFAEAMLKVRPPDIEVDKWALDIAKFLETTTVHVATWKEQFVTQAEAAITAFKDAFTGPMAEIGSNMDLALNDVIRITNKAINSGLIGQAQSGMEAFRDCVSKKMFDLPLLQDRAMSDLVGLTNKAINSGLRGEAQKNIALFVECAQSKQLRMVDEIDQSQQELLKIYDSNTDKINKLTASGLDQEAQLYKDSNDDILTSISQLMVWRDAIVTGKKIPDPFAGMPEYTLKAQDDVAAFIAKLGEIPETRDTVLNVNNTNALSAIEAVLAALAKIHDVSATITSVNEPIGLGAFQHGGFVPETGPYILHAGEAVIPEASLGAGREVGGAAGLGASPVTLNPSFTIPVRLDVDGQMMYQVVEKRMVDSRRLRASW